MPSHAASEAGTVFGRRHTLPHGMKGPHRPGYRGA
jgi:hypothetical protein